MGRAPIAFQQEPNYLPTKKEIRQKCLEIQETWSPSERKKRSKGLDVSEMCNTVQIKEVTVMLER